jgi:hypothetical protein
MASLDQIPMHIRCHFLTYYVQSSCKKMKKSNKISEIVSRVILFITASILIGNAYSQGCSENLVSYWKMDETTGTILTETVIGNDATRHNSSADPVAGKIDGAQHWYYASGTPAGAGEYATAPDNDIYSFPANSGFTISYWLKFNMTQYGIGTGQDHLIISKGDWGYGSPSTAFWASGVNGSGFISFMLRDDATGKTDLEGRVYGQDNFDDNEWHHVACVRNGATDECMIYVDGRITDRQVVNYTSSFDNSAPIYIGSLTNGTPQYFYWGEMDELAIFNKALSKAEIDEIRANADLGTGLCTLQANPEFTSTPVTKATVGSAYSYTAHAKGTQTDMTYSLLSKPTGMTIDQGTGAISWTPGSINLDAYVQVKADNGIAPADTQRFMIYLSEGGVDCPTGLVTLHRLNEKSGTTYADLKGDHNASVPQGYTGPSPSAGLIGDGAQTFGASTRVDIPDNGTEFDWSQNGSFSFESWFRTTSSGVAALSRNRVDLGHVTSWWIGTSPQGTGIIELRDNAGTNTVLKGTTVIADGDWHHVIGVRDGVANQNRLYVDGVLEGTLNQAFAADFSAPGSLPVAIGYLTPWEGENQLHLIGDIDEVAIFNRAVTGAEAAAFYNNGNPTGHCSSSNYAPVFLSTPVTAVNEDVAYSYTLSIDDIDATDTLTLSAPVKPSWASFSWTAGQKTAILSGTPPDAGTYNVTLRVSDKHITHDQVFSINVANVVDAPAFSSTPITSVNENAAYSYTVTVTDADASDDISITAVTLPAWLTLNHAAGARTATITGTPARANIGTHPVKISASDGYVTVEQSYTLTVVSVNTPPVITGQSALNVNEDESITLLKSNLTITDAQNPASDISIVVQEGTNYTFTGNTVTPVTDFNGMLSVNVIARDLLEDGLPYAVSVTVNPVNDPPEVTSEPGLTASVGYLYYYIMTATDVDNITLTKSVVTKPDWLNFSALGGVISGTPIESSVGEHLIVMQVSDGTNVVDKTFTLTVTGPTGIDDAESKGFVIYPVPVRDELKIRFNKLSEETLVEIISSTGSVVHTSMVQANAVSAEIPVQDIEAGIYICHIRNNTLNATSRFLIVK